MKTCSTCLLEKPLDEFYSRGGVEKGKRSSCIKCDKARSTRWQKNNPEKTRESTRKSSRKYYWGNHEASKLRAKAANSRYKKSHPEVGRQNFHRRRARKIGNGVFKIIPKDLQRLQRTPCQECGTMKKLTIDHVVPISKGGTHSIGNLQSLCIHCNCSKNNKFIIERKLANANRR